MQRLLLVDFDGTLFNSDEFHKDVAIYLNAKYKIPLEDVNFAYNQAKIDGKPHSLKKQLQVIGFKNVNGLIKEIKQDFLATNKNYLYPETLEFLKANKGRIIIYTYAIEEYYKFKLSLTGLNKLRLPVIVVESNKNHYLRENYQKDIQDRIKTATIFEEILWVDDKIDAFLDPIPGIKFVRIKREGEKYANLETPKHAKEITHLLQEI